MLEIKLDSIYRKTVGSIENVSLDGEVAIPNDVSTSGTAKVKVKGSLNRLEDSVLIYLSGVSSFDTLCDRCQIPFILNTKFNVEVILNNNDIIHLKRWSYILDAHISENILLLTPIKKICRTDCLGLCPNCGVDRNNKQCNCPTSNQSKNPFSILRKGKNGSAKEKNLPRSNRNKKKSN